MIAACPSGVNPMDSTQTYDSLADVYDLMYPASSPDIKDAVDFLARMCPEGGKILEFGVGSGRLAVPLAQRGFEVHGVDGAQRMLDKLAERDTDARVRAFAADFTKVSTGETYDVVFIALNTLFALHTAAQQVECVTRMREHLAPGGRVVIEAFDPMPYHQQQGEHTSTRYLSPTSVMLDSSHVVRTQQLVLVIHTVLDGTVPRPTQEILRYAWPSEIDLMARIAGLRLVGRTAGWREEPYDEKSDRHISVYAVDDVKDQG